MEEETRAELSRHQKDGHEDEPRGRGGTGRRLWDGGEAKEGRAKRSRQLAKRDEGGGGEVKIGKRSREKRDQRPRKDKGDESCWQPEG